MHLNAYKKHNAPFVCIPCKLKIKSKHCKITKYTQHYARMGARKTLVCIALVQRTHDATCATYIFFCFLSSDVHGWRSGIVCCFARFKGSVWFMVLCRQHACHFCRRRWPTTTVSVLSTTIDWLGPHRRMYGYQYSNTVWVSFVWWVVYLYTNNIISGGWHLLLGGWA